MENEKLNNACSDDEKEIVDIRIVELKDNSDGNKSVNSLSISDVYNQNEFRGKLCKIIKNVMIQVKCLIAWYSLMMIYH